MAQNPNVAVSLEDASDPLVIQGTAALLDEIPADVAKAFKRKYEWNIRGDRTYDVIVEIAPLQVIL